MAWSGEQASLLLVTLAMMVQSAGAACVLTSAQSLASMAAIHTDRGMVMGVFSSAGTLGRTLGTVVTGSLFAYVYVHFSYLLGACLSLALLYLSRSAAPIVEMRAQAK